MATETKPNKPAKRQALEFLRSSAVSAKPTGVDEERKKISGVILAKTGPFKSGRGEFDLKSLNMLAKIIGSKSKGSKSRMGHPNPSHPGARQEVDSFLGRFSDPRVEPNPDEPDGHVLRGDLALDPVSFLSKSGGVSDGDYLMARAKSDPDSFGTSLVLSAEREYRMDNHRKPKLDENGDELPPLWRPVDVAGIDIVDDGDATDGLLANTEDAYTKIAGVLDANLEGFSRGTIMAIFQLWVSSRFPCDWDDKLELDDEGSGDAEAAETAMAAACEPPAADNEELLRLRWRNAKRKAGVEGVPSEKKD